jgi:hypothetical protein
MSRKSNRAMSCKAAAKVAFGHMPDLQDTMAQLQSQVDAWTAILAASEGGDAPYPFGHLEGLTDALHIVQVVSDAIAALTEVEWIRYMEAAAWAQKSAKGVEGGALSKASANRQLAAKQDRAKDKVKAAKTKTWLDAEIDKAAHALKTGHLTTGHLKTGQLSPYTDFKKFTAFRLVELLRPKFRRRDT